MTTKTPEPEPNGDDLVRPKRSVAAFAKEVARQRGLGFSDAELVQSMIQSRVLVDPLGPALPRKRLRYGVK
jgi:hypothetical protein